MTNEILRELLAVIGKVKTLKESLENVGSCQSFDIARAEDMLKTAYNLISGAK